MKRKERTEAMFYGSATVGVKGQVVIPFKLRRDSNIKPGDSLIFIGMPEQGGFGVMKPEAILRLQKKFEKLRGQLTRNIKK